MAFRHKYHWHPEEDTYLEHHVRLTGAEACAHHLGRTLGAVRARYAMLRAQRRRDAAARQIPMVFLAP